MYLCYFFNVAQLKGLYRNNFLSGRTESNLSTLRGLLHNYAKDRDCGKNFPKKPLLGDCNGSDLYTWRKTTRQCGQPNLRHTHSVPSSMWSAP